MSAHQTVTSVPSGQDFVLLTAPLFVGSLLNCLLFGTLMVQMYLYSILYPRDKVGIKVLVYAIFMLDMIQTILSTHSVWRFLVSGWGNHVVFVQPPWSVATISFMGAIISAIVQIFFAWRIWTLKKTRIARGIASVIVLVALMQSSSIMVASMRFALVGNFAELSAVSSGVIVGVSGSFIADALIAGCQIAILSEARSKCPFKKTETLITKLIVHTVQTAAVTAITSLMLLILYKAMPNTFMFLIPVFVIGKLYSNVLLANLNARLPESGGGSPETGTPPINLTEIVHITTETVTDRNKSPGN